MIAKRSVATAIILSLLTCGIYFIIWMISLSNEVSAYNGENQEGGMEFLLMLVTCGIYGIYWHYKMGQKLLRAKQRAGQYAQDNSILYLLLSIFGLSIVSVAIMQSQANEL
ncbi:DUF4234 domain-containing protein [Clostridium thermarum]|uniref:DUF4234 domain-containing protein n=1 Tax=Clostridium thermarum TaxID=1716543 RepID=UPI001123A806|nr:DUF4234 domain-containing protein [Clostridium thermarum]